MNDQPTDFSAAHAAAFLLDFSTASPLVHCLTNDVVQSFTANVLLALGASPAMVVDPGEAAQFATLADALLINVGTLESTRADAMLAAVQSANQAGKPWVLDPVAVGGLRFRTDFVHKLLPYKPAAIRGNASEIIALSGVASQGRGVDSHDASFTAIPAARELATRWSTVVAVTGEVDYVTDGVRVCAVNGGHAVMTRVVGTGCALSAVVAAFCARGGDMLFQVATACAVMAQAGERAAAQSSGPGSFTPAFLDALALLRQEAQACAL
ncbi:hydroxyethylthiazole kinase [Candidatus Symbiopectobacterium sp. NZEC135]|uniref:hydroxyethylthiazole kinase n=1 Tax=Candidatus Symbiopectobacterium sp. NZEC135 TaxID=2820471 RepID=UPI00222707F4|nr:hydroxyethylthiazole kinase [Candidatus Symbiopectobacterium sp. NZEC135]MCW2477569.1 hydroxyethylthiazole kinase [Candidatus Symbiopectobacterium sp. NZEC135]